MAFLSFPSGMGAHTSLCFQSVTQSLVTHLSRSPVCTFSPCYPWAFPPSCLSACCWTQTHTWSFSLTHHSGVPFCFWATQMSILLFTPKTSFCFFPLIFYQSLLSVLSRRVPHNMTSQSHLVQKHRLYCNLLFNFL